MRELAALHSSNVKLCLNVPNYGKYLPGSRVSDIFTFLGEALPSPKPEQQADFDFVIDEIATLIAGLLEYFHMSQAVFKGIYLGEYFMLPSSLCIYSFSRSFFVLDSIWTNFS